MSGAIPQELIAKQWSCLLKNAKLLSELHWFGVLPVARLPRLKSAPMSRVLASALALVCGASMAGWAAPSDWQAVVIGQPGRGAESAFADAFHASSALTEAGFTSVLMLRDIKAEKFELALETMQSAPKALIYFAGTMSADGKAFRLRGGDLELQTLIDDLSASGTGEIVLLVETCVKNVQGIAQPLALPTAPANTALVIHTTTEASATAPAACPGQGLRLTEALKGSGDTLSARLTSFPSTGSLPVPLALGAAPSPVVITPEQNAASAAPAPTRIIQNDVVALTPVATPVRPTTALTPIPIAQPAQTTTGQSDAVVIFAPPAGSQLAAQPAREGLPDPSIIVGIIEGNNGTFDQVDDGAVSSNEIAYDNLEARNALKASDPEMFASLVAGGAFDPPAQDMARALQTELSRMGCYRAGIDGIWGGGSRAAVQRYFDELDDVVPVSLEPVAELFRQLILGKEVECPAPAPVAQTRTTTTRSTATRSTTTRTTPTRQTTTRSAPKPSTSSSSGRTIQSGNTLGVFR